MCSTLHQSPRLWTAVDLKEESHGNERTYDLPCNNQAQLIKFSAFFKGVREVSNDVVYLRKTRVPRNVLVRKFLLVYRGVRLKLREYFRNTLPLTI